LVGGTTFGLHLGGRRAASWYSEYAYQYFRTMNLVLTGALAIVINLAFAFLIVKFVALPLHGPMTHILESIWPDVLRPYVDPVNDRTYVLMGCSGLSAYVIVAMLLCTLMDCLPGVYRYKTQQHRSFFTLSEWLQAVGVGLGNLFLFSWFATIPCWTLQRRGGGPGEWEEPLSVPRALAHFVIHGLVIDVWFYSTHYLLHSKLLYARIHKFHHRFKAPTAVACVYANPIEFVIGSVGGVVLGPALTRCHPYLAAFWMAYALTATSMTHSGWRIFGADDHDAHHEFFHFNYGVGLFMDKLMGTCLPAGYAKGAPGGAPAPWNARAREDAHPVLSGVGESVDRAAAGKRPSKEKRR